MAFDQKTILEIVSYGTGAVLVGLLSQVILEVVFLAIAKIVSLFRSAL